MHPFLLIISLTLTFSSFGQYPFERFPAIIYKEYNDWTEIDNRKSVDKAEHSLTVPKFFNKRDSLSMKVTTLTKSWDTTYISLYRNGKLLQTFVEPFGYNPIEPLLRLADLNGDGLTDLKLIFPNMGNGTASLNVRVVYLLQTKENRFAKVSYFDKLGANIVERDFNGDGNYEIITMTLMDYQNHSYWAYNLFNFKNFELVSVNNKYNYPILIQFLYRDNFKITSKISRQKMKEFAHKKPEQYSRQYKYWR